MDKKGRDEGRVEEGRKEWEKKIERNEGAIERGRKKKENTNIMK